MRRLAPVLAASILVLTACGGSEFRSAEAVAEELGCEGLTPEEVAGADEAVTCTIDDDEYRIAWFADDDGRRTYELSAENSKKVFVEDRANDPDDFAVVIGDNWGVECRDTSCDEVLDALGGERV